MIERPGQGRARITDDGHILKVIIPVKKRLIATAIVVLVCLSFAWFMYNIFSDGVSGSKLLDFHWRVFFDPFGFILLLLIILIYINWALQYFFGKEWIDVSNGILTLHKGILPFGLKKHYSFDNIKNFGLASEQDNHRSFSLSWRWPPKREAFAFDYGMDTIKFADTIDEAEARYLLVLFEQKGLRSGQGIRLGLGRLP